MPKLLVIVAFLCLCLAFLPFTAFGDQCIEGNCVNGYGRKSYSNGQKYSGEFKNGERNGLGALIFPDGRKYEGDFLNGKRSGKGKMTYPDGRVYTGDFVDGKRSGDGEMTLPGRKRFQSKSAD